MVIQILKNFAPVLIIGFIFLAAYIKYKNKVGYYNQTEIGERNKNAPQVDTKKRGVVYLYGEPAFVYKDRYLLLGIVVWILLLVVMTFLWTLTDNELFLFIIFIPAFLVMPMPLFYLMGIFDYKAPK